MHALFNDSLALKIKVDYRNDGEILLNLFIIYLYW